MLKNICTCLVIGTLLNLFSLGIDSSFLSDFLKTNLIMIFVGLLAVHVTTIFVVITKLRELRDKFKVDFSRTVGEIRSSFTEQIVLTAVSVIIFIARYSKMFKNSWQYSEFASDSILLACFAYEFFILYDIASAAFIIYDRDLKNTESLPPHN